MSAEVLPCLAERLAGLAAFVPIFAREGFSFGTWHIEEGHMPWFDFSNAAEELVQTAYRLGWVTPNFVWHEWGYTPEARRLIDDTQAVACATVRDIERLLTVHIRADRFGEGHLESVFTSGHLLAILRRADALLREIRA